MAVVIVSAPATPLYLSRIRFCMSASHTTEDVKESIEKLKECIKFTGIDFNNNTKELFKNCKESITNTDTVLSWSNLYDNKRIIYSLPAEIYVYNKDKDKKFVNLFG